MRRHTGGRPPERKEDALSYAGSLSKMMTFYLVFEAIDNGQLKLDQRLPVSLHAASRAPTKLGLQPGESVAVRDIILGLVTKSANDAAAVAAEGLAGNEGAFAERVTQKARRPGMKNTFFHKPSRLPDPAHK